MAHPTQFLNNGGTPAPANQPMQNLFGQQQPTQTKTKSKAWIIAPIAGGSALTFGGLGVAAYTLHNQDEEAVAVDPAVTEEVLEETEDNQDMVEANENIEESPVETNVVTFNPANVHQSFAVNDDMSFAQAFEAARLDVGPGGVFVWHGGVYGTYTVNEWNSMSDADRDAFASSFHYSAPADHENTDTQIAETDPIASDPNAVALVPEDDDPEIMLIGQEYDPENDMTLAYITDGDNVAMLADVDNDGTYDFLVSDFDGNGEISDDEVIDISDGQLTQAQVDSLPEYSEFDPYDDIMA